MMKVKIGYNFRWKGNRGTSTYDCWIEALNMDTNHVGTSTHFQEEPSREKLTEMKQEAKQQIFNRLQRQKDGENFLAKVTDVLGTNPEEVEIDI